MKGSFSASGSLALAVTAFAVVVFLPALARACPVCFTGTENREEYFVTFVLLTVLPLLSVGGILYWIIRRVRQGDRADQTHRP